MRAKEFFMKKNLVKFLGIAALAAVIGFGMAGCSTDDGGGGSIDPAKLIGTWQNDGNAAVSLEFDNLSTMGPETVFDITDASTGHQIWIMASIEGDVIDFPGGTSKVAFEGDKLKLSESTGDMAGYDGIYTKQ
jgi:hypothetical protein